MARCRMWWWHARPACSCGAQGVQQASAQHICMHACTPLPPESGQRACSTAHVSTTAEGNLQAKCCLHAVNGRACTVSMKVAAHATATLHMHSAQR